MTDFDTENYTQITVRVPTKLLASAEELANFTSIRKAELHRLFWILGMQSFNEGNNKVMISTKLQNQVVSEG